MDLLGRCEQSCAYLITSDLTSHFGRPGVAPHFANSENVARSFLKHPTMDTSPNGGWMGAPPAVEYLEFEGFRTTEKSSAVRGRGKVTESHFGLISLQFCSRAELGEVALHHPTA